MHDSGTRQIGAELLLTLDRSSPTPLRAQLEHGLRELIRSGAVAADSSVPSTRTLAGDLGVSRRLIVEAYAQLTAEGYLRTQERAGTRVAPVTAATSLAIPDEPPPARFDLRPGIPSLAHFPRNAWAKATAAALKAAPDAALAYPDPRGSLLLRKALSEYLRRVRAVAADPERIVICTGFRQALSLLIGALRMPTVAVEEPGLIGREQTVTAAGGTPLPIEVDQRGLRVDLLADSSADAAVVTPAHQFPLGVTLSPDRRAALVAWARSTGLVIEDDYDAEFRYDREPIGSLHGLAPEHVAYIGTTSKTLAPGLRLGWMVAPCALLDPVTEAKQAHDGGSPTIDQLALAHMLTTGTYERHLRLLRRHYRARRDQLISSLRRHLPAAKPGGTAAGLHLMLELSGDIEATSVTEAARRLDLAVAPLERYTLSPPGPTRNRLVIGYGNILTPTIEQAVRRLSQAVADVR
jgi:GntR family transcriptional regulator/MocR family aminotransferase